MKFPLSFGFVAVVCLFRFASPAVAASSPLEPGQLKPWLESIRARNHVPALGAAIISGDQITPAVTGLRKAGNPTAAQIGDSFHLGSCSKAMTATLIAFLIQDGKLKWSSTLSQIFPQWSKGMRPEYRAVTVRQLLNQRTGFSEASWPAKYGAGYWFDSKAKLPTQRALYARAILAEAPGSKPGTHFLYSNRNYILAGTIAEKVTGKSWENLMRDRIFGPLGMKSAGFGPTAAQDQLNGLWAHPTVDGKLVPLSGKHSDNPAVLGPAGTVHCSMADWAKFVRFLERSGQGREKRLSKASFQALTTPPPGSDYACGWMALQRGWGHGTVLTHSGSNRMNFCTVWLAPRRNFAVLVATNVGDGAALCDQVASALILELDKSTGTI